MKPKVRTPHPRSGSGNLAAITPVLLILVLSVVLIPASQSVFTGATQTFGTLGAASDDLRFFTGVDADADLVWWLDSSKTSTLYTDLTCALPSAVGGNVGCWKDRRSTSTHKVTGLGTPTRTATTINGMNPLRFTGVSALAGPDYFGGSAGNVTIFMVSRENARVTNFLLSLNGTTTGATRFSMHHPWSDGVYYFDAGDSGTDRVQSPANLTTVGATTLAAAWTDSVEAKNHLQINRGQILNSAGHTTGTTSGGLNIGAVNASYQPNHDIAELMIFSRVLTAAERYKIADYLQTKWATP